MNIIDYDKIELQFEEDTIILPTTVIEKFEIQKVEQLIEKKYNPEDEYEVYIVINRILAEEIWREDASKKFERNSNRMDTKYRWHTKIQDLSRLH